MQAQAAGLLSQGIVLGTFRHGGLKGIEREEPVRSFLRSHLPGRFHVGQGSVASSEIILDRQHDIMVADRDSCFMLLNTIAAQLLTIESLHLIVEVRSQLGDIDDVSESLMKVRQLVPKRGLRQLGFASDVNVTGPPVHTLIAYQGPTAETAMQQLAKANETQTIDGARYPIDFVLVLSQKDKGTIDTGYLIGYSRTDDEGREFQHHYYPTVNQPKLEGPKIIVKGPLSFAYCYASILNHLSGVTAYPPNFHAYLGHTVTILPWTDKPS
jgi:hypothetical protein